MIFNNEFFFGNNINLCFIYGKIISDLDFKFVYNSKKHVSKITFFIEICENKREEITIPAKAYDLLADSIYQNLKNGDYIYITGRVEIGGIEIENYEINYQFS